MSQRTNCCTACVTMCMLVTLGWLGVALGHDVDGKLGVGYEDTLTNIGMRQAFQLRDSNNNAPDRRLPDAPASGLAVRRYIGNFGIEGIVGIGAHLPDGAPAEWGGFLSVGGSYNFVRAPQVNLGLGVRVLVGLARTNVGVEAGPVRFGLALEAPLRVEYFFNQQFAIAGAVGPTLSLNGDRLNPLTGQKGSIDVALSRGEFSGGVGFTYYLN